jgi:hypothetical protein
VNFDIALAERDGGWKADASVKSGDKTHVSMRDIQLTSADV